MITQIVINQNKSDEELKAEILNELEDRNVDQEFRKVDIDKLMLLKYKGNSNKDIAKIFNCCEEHIKVILDKFEFAVPDKERVNIIKKYDIDKITSIQGHILDLLDRNMLSKCSGSQLAIIYGILFDKKQLAQNKPTINVSMIKSGEVESLEVELKKVNSELENLQSGAIDIEVIEE